MVTDISHEGLRQLLRQGLGAAEEAKAHPRHLPAPSRDPPPVRNEIGEALKQLRPYRDRSEPLIVCLANRVGWLLVASENSDDVIAAVYGEPGVRVSIAALV